MFSSTDKQAIVAMLTEQLVRMTDTALRAMEAAREGIQVGGERTRNRGERGQFMEETYLISAQMKQADAYQALQRSLAGLELAPARKVQAGSLLTVEEENGPAGETVYFLVPGAMGLTVEFRGEIIRLVSPDSPLGQALLGKRPGARIQMPARGGPKTIRLTALA